MSLGNTENIIGQSNQSSMDGEKAMSSGNIAVATIPPSGTKKEIFEPSDNAAYKVLILVINNLMIDHYHCHAILGWWNYLC